MNKEIEKKLISELMNEGFKKATIYNYSINLQYIRKMNENEYNKSTIIKFSSTYPFSNFLRGKIVEAYKIRTIYTHFTEILYKIIDDAEEEDDDDIEIDNKYDDLDFDETFNDLYNKLLNSRNKKDWKEYKHIKNELVLLMKSNGFEEILIPYSYAKSELFNDVNTDTLVTIEVPDNVKSKFFGLLKNETIQYYQLRIDKSGFSSIGMIRILE